jgi:HEAT repeat protein
MVGEALQKLGSLRAEDAYIKGLDKGAWWMQSSCAEMLGEMRSEKGLDPLIKAAANGEDRLRRAAVLALSKYPARFAESALKQALEDEDWQVRMYAEEGLKNLSREKGDTGE